MNSLYKGIAKPIFLVCEWAHKMVHSATVDGMNQDLHMMNFSEDYICTLAKSPMAIPLMK